MQDLKKIFDNIISKSAKKSRLELKVDEHITNIVKSYSIDRERFLLANDQIQNIKVNESKKTLPERINDMEKGGEMVMDKAVLNNDTINKFIVRLESTEAAESIGLKKAAESIASKIIYASDINDNSCPSVSFLNDIRTNLKVIGILNNYKDFPDQLNISTSELAAKNHIHIVNNKLLPEVTEEALAVRNYMSIETDKKKLEDFASKQLQNYCNKQDVSKLNGEVTENISKAMIAILEPLCENDEEKKESLKKNTAQLVRKCAKKAGAKMSFGEAWKAYIIDPIKKLFERKNKVEKIIEENLDIVNSFKKSINTSNTVSINPILPKKARGDYQLAK